jgi:hypothetical protein
VGGTAVFWAALGAEMLVLACHFFLKIGYLWYNPIGCATCVLLSVVFQTVLGPGTAAAAQPVTPASSGPA